MPFPRVEIVFYYWCFAYSTIIKPIPLEDSGIAFGKVVSKKT